MDTPTKETIAFSQLAGTIPDFLREELPAMTDQMIQDFLEFLSNACHYAEEEEKIMPHILLGSNLASKEFTQVTHAYLIPFSKKAPENAKIKKQLKSTLPFCNEGWTAYMDLSPAESSCGILQVLKGPSCTPLEKSLPRLSENISYISVQVISSYGILLTGRSRAVLLDFRLENHTDSKDTGKEFLRDILSALPRDDDKTLPFSAAMENLVQQFPRKLHGTICLTVKSSFLLSDCSLLKDGMILENPISLYDLFKNVVGEDKTASSDAAAASCDQFFALSNALIRMMNMDGITVMDDKCRILAFNIFVKPKDEDADETVGGARARAAKFLANQKIDGFLGVYYQSQDGKNEYYECGKEQQ